MSMTEPYTGAWWLYTGLSASELGAKLGELHAHIADLETYDDGGRRRFTAVLLADKGAASWWYFGLTADQVGAKLAENGAVPTTLTAYHEGNQLRFAVAMQKRAGQGYWWYFGLTADQLGAKLAENHAAPVEISPYLEGGTLKFAAVMVPDREPSWWYFGQTAEGVGAKLRETGGRLHMLRAYAAGADTRFVAIIRKPDGAPWWWYFGQTIDAIFDNVRTNGAYVADITTYLSGGTRRFACVMRARPWPTTNAAQHEAIRRMLAATHKGGWHGFYCRRIGGAVLQAFNETVAFDPASAIKALNYTHAMRAVQDGKRIGTQQVTLETTIPVPPGIGSLPRPQGTDCPFDEINTDAADKLPLKLAAAMESMMKRSRNAPTEAIRRFFGPAEVAATARALGLTDTRHNGPTGCTRNSASLVDFGKLYEQCSQGYLDATHWAAFRQHALGEPLNEVVDICDEFAKSTRLGAGFAARFRTHMLSVHKSGRGTDSVEKACVAGYVALPFCDRGRIVQRHYVYGVFVDNADRGTLNDGFNQNRIAAEMLRDEIKAAVQSFVDGTCSA